jgi:hypothetical protein
MSIFILLKQKIPGPIVRKAAVKKAVVRKVVIKAIDK